MRSIVTIGGSVATGCALWIGATSTTDTSRLKILVPLYIYPDRNWDVVAAAAKKTTIVAIINPNSGPDGKPPNTEYRRGIDLLKRSGVKVIGYVPTNYGKRPIDSVKADVDLYAKHYGIHGIFFDEGASDRLSVDYYRQLSQYSRQQRHFGEAIVIVNPGTNVDPAYFQQQPVATTVIFENRANAWPNYRAPEYARQHPAATFASLVHSVPNAGLMREYVRLAKQRNFGYIYVTDDSTDRGDRNPWNSLPSYWPDFVSTVRSANTNP
jgi:hypothetical protein